APEKSTATLAPWPGHAPSSAASAESAAPPVAPDPAALAELLAAAPKRGPQSTSENGGTLVGTATGEKEPSATDAGGPKNEAPKPAVEVGEMQLEATMSSPAIERASRQQLYYRLVTRCKDKAGKILPPDAVKLDFLIDPDGYIAPGSIVATTEDPA